MSAKQLTPSEKRQQEITLIIATLPKNRAVEVLVLNGHAKDEGQAIDMIGKANGVK